MNKLHKFLFLSIALTAIGSFVGCNNDVPETDFSVYTDARILKFSLQKSDTLFSNWEDVYFAIDQNTGLIYNNDSLPVGTKINKVLSLIEYASVSKVEYKKQTVALSETENEWKEYENSDSIDFSSPLIFKVTALDKTTTKEYTIKVNVHTQDPELLVWNKITSDRLPSPGLNEKSVLLNDILYTLVRLSDNSLILYTSLDFAQVESQTTHLGLPTDVDIETLTASDSTLWVTTLSGMLFMYNGSTFTHIVTPESLKLIGWIAPYSQIEGRLILHTKDNTNPKFASYKTKSNELVISNQIVPYGFPDNGAGITNHTVNNASRTTLIGGTTFERNPSRKVFQFLIENDELKCSNDLLSSISPTAINLREATQNSAFFYNNRLFVFEGFVENGNTRKPNRLVYSLDYGINWIATTTKEQLPEEMKLRSLASIVVDKNNFIWIIGGVDENNNLINDLWKGRINRLGHIIQ